MSTKPPLDTDGKLVVKVVPQQVRVMENGMIHIENKELMEFLRKRTVDENAHVILMGADCGCKCCC